MQNFRKNDGSSYGFFFFQKKAHVLTRLNTLPAPRYQCLNVTRFSAIETSKVWLIEKKRKKILHRPGKECLVAMTTSGTFPIQKERKQTQERRNKKFFFYQNLKFAIKLSNKIKRWIAKRSIFKINNEINK